MVNWAKWWRRGRMTSIRCKRYHRVLMGNSTTSKRKTSHWRKSCSSSTKSTVSFNRRSWTSRNCSVKKRYATTRCGPTTISSRSSTTVLRRRFNRRRRSESSTRVEETTITTTTTMTTSSRTGMLTTKATKTTRVTRLTRVTQWTSRGMARSKIRMRVATTTTISSDTA